MVSVRAHPKLAFTLVVAVVVAMTGILWWLIPNSGGDAVDASAIVRDACQQAQVEESVDVTIQGSRTSRDSAIKTVTELRASGQDFHQITYDSNGVARGEWIILDNWDYSREANENGVWEEWVVQKLHGTEPDPLAQEEPDPTGTEADLLLQGEPGPTGTVDDAPSTGGPATFCGMGGLLDVTHLGNARVDDTPVKHFSAHVDPELIGGGDNYDRYEFWVDEGGTLLQAKADIYRDSRGGLPEHRVEYTATYSGHGEPNVITAPEIP